MSRDTLHSDTLVLEGLSCASCAAKIQFEIQAMPEIRSASLDFVTKKLTYQAADTARQEELSDELRAVVKRIEPEVTIRTEHETRGEVQEKAGPRGKTIALSIGVALFIAALVFPVPQLAQTALFFASFLLAGGPVLLQAGRRILSGTLFDEHFLMSIATIGAFAIGEHPEGAAVMIFYRIGEYFQDRAVERSRNSIAELMDIRPSTASVKRDGTVYRVDPSEVAVGEFIIVQPGQLIPLDGTVRDGRSSLDTSALTGESAPREVAPGSQVLSGSVNSGGLLTIEVSKLYTDSTVAKILDLVEHAGSRKAPTEQFITKFARYYTPVVVGTAVLLATVVPLALEGALSAQWLHRALVFLVVSCPCALVISIPLGFFGGIGRASREGVLVKGGNFLEALNQVDTVVFDKTGTLTEGTFSVTDVQPADGFEQQELLAFAALAEAHSTHPLARSVRDAFGKDPGISSIEGYEEFSGFGVQVSADSRVILAGSRRLMGEQGIEIDQQPPAGATAVHVAVDGIYAGSVILTDRLKKTSKETVQALRKLGVRRIVMLTGDSRSSGEGVSQALGLDEVYSQLLPQDKVAIFERLAGESEHLGKVVFVGDGINDSPVLARADVGVAMGGLGSDAAIEAADVVLMSDEPFQLVTALRVARKTRAVLWQNIALALGVKGTVLILGVGGLAALWAAVFADVGVALLAVVNALRVVHGSITR